MKSLLLVACLLVAVNARAVPVLNFLFLQNQWEYLMTCNISEPGNLYINGAVVGGTSGSIEELLNIPLQNSFVYGLNTAHAVSLLDGSRSETIEFQIDQPTGPRPGVNVPDRGATFGLLAASALALLIFRRPAQRSMKLLPVMCDIRRPRRALRRLPPHPRQGLPFGPDQSQ
jgi:hypothetical protein